MYINPFYVGIATTLAFEFVALCIYAYYLEKGKRR